MLRRDLETGAHLRLPEESDADELFKAVDANRAHLRPWLPWVDKTRSAEDTLAFIRSTRKQIADNDGLQTAIVQEHRIVGMVGFHFVDWESRSTEIGYWLGAAAQGRGTMTAAVRALLDHAFGVWELNRVEIRVSPENPRSRAVPERLGFTEEGRLAQAERVGDRYVDNVVYALLAGVDRRSSRGLVM